MPGQGGRGSALGAHRILLVFVAGFHVERGRDDVDELGEELAEKLDTLPRKE